jgi:NodT family efflux transporter outer membrane factor (OMF) lipoprotein
LGDPLLTDLVEQAVAGNLNLKMATARVREVRARKRVAAANLLPDFTASGKGAVTYRRDDAGRWNSNDNYAAGLDAAWEIDLFGGTRREIEAASGEVQASLEELRNVLVSLTAEVASSYVLLRTYERRLEVARENLSLQMETLELTQIKYQTGLAGELNVQQAAYNLETTRALIPALEGGAEEMKNRLAVLLGLWRGQVSASLAAPGPIPTAPLETAVGMPADLLRRRPDIRAAERRLAAQTARIGAAESDLYPKLTLNGSLGWTSLSLGSLISAGNFAALIGGAVSWNVLNTEAVRGNIEIQNSLQQQALIEYETTLRTAVEEVANALTALVKESRKQAALEKGVEAARQAAELALQEYENGISDFQNVVATQQSLRSLEDRLADSRGQATQDLILLYKALGGGWSAEVGPEPPTASR